MIFTFYTHLYLWILTNIMIWNWYFFMVHYLYILNIDFFYSNLFLSILNTFLYFLFLYLHLANFHCAYCNTLWPSLFRMYAMLPSSKALPLWVLEQRVSEWLCVRCEKSELCKTKIMTKKLERSQQQFPILLMCLYVLCVLQCTEWYPVD